MSLLAAALCAAATMTATCADPIDVNANRRTIRDTSSGQPPLQNDAWPVAVDGAAIDFGNGCRDSFSVRTITLRDTSATDSAHVERIELAAGSPFQIDQFIPVTLAPRGRPGDSLVIVVRYPSPRPGTATGTVAVYRDKVPSESPLRSRHIPVYGVWSMDTVMHVDSLDFFTVDSSTVTIRPSFICTGDCFAATVTDIRVSGPDAPNFGLVSTGRSLPAYVRPNDTLTYSIRLTAMRRGTMAASLTFQYSSIFGARSVRVPIRGVVL